MEMHACPQHRRAIRGWCLRLSYATIVSILVTLPHHLLAGDPIDIEAGSRTFMIHCEACHGPEGTGGIGPNLTDQFILHGGTLDDILSVVTNGVPGKPMYSWKNRLDPANLRSVAAYVYGLKGTRPVEAPSVPIKLM
jgi:cbb3-type cytochrome c oxidase subunit III